MSPTLLQRLREIQLETHRLATLAGVPPMPLSDFYRAAEQLRRQGRR